MNIISLTEIQFKNYSRIHSKRNYFQSIEFANMQKNNGYTPLYVGLIDEKNNLIAASLILSKKIIGKYLYGYVPGGFLIDYTNYNLISDFTKLLQKYLYNLNYVYIKTTPLCPIRVMNKNNIIVFEENRIIKNLDLLGYKKSKKDFFNTSIILNIKNNNTMEIYTKLSRFIKRNIKDNKVMGIKIFKGSINDVEQFYNLISKKTNYDINYYINLFKYFNNDNNKFDIYFAALDTNTYLKNYQNLLDIEKRKNEKISEKIINLNIKNKKYYINKKIKSDKLIEKYNNEIKKALKINTVYKNELIIATVGIIKTNNEINFLIEGYEEKLRNIRASYSIKWEIIKKYIEEGYGKFNLGYMPKKDKKFNGLYLSRLGFNSNIVEYPGQYNLIINSTIYNFINFVDKRKYQ